jgi:hypothetical protein
MMGFAPNEEPEGDFTRLLKHRDTLQAENARLQAIVAKLPKTADGHIYLPWEDDGVEGKYWAVWRYWSEDDNEPWQVCPAHIEIGEAPSYWVIEEAEDENIEVLGIYRRKKAAEAAGGRADPFVEAARCQARHREAVKAAGKKQD